MHPQAKRYILLVIFALFAGVAGPRAAWADDPRVEARTHYQAGLKFYGSGDYKSAIREFSSAQQLAPADLNNYNLGLCYDKLGDAQPAIQYYKEYLNKVPNADKRAEIEASVARLESAVKSAEAKKAEEAKKLEDARRADDAKKADEAKRIEDARKADDARRADEDAKRAGAGAVGAGAAGVGAGAAGVGAGVDVGVSAGAGAAGAGAGAATGVGSTGVPGTGQTTGDMRLDRVQQIDINAIREQRVGGTSSGIPDRSATPGAGAGVGAAGPNPNMAPNPGPGVPPPNVAAANAQGAQGQGPLDKPQPKETPVYKKWWFWAVVAVSAYVVFEIATQDSTSTPTKTGRQEPTSMHNVPSSGLTLWHF